MTTEPIYNSFKDNRKHQKLLKRSIVLLCIVLFLVSLIPLTAYWLNVEFYFLIIYFVLSVIMMGGLIWLFNLIFLKSYILIYPDCLKVNRFIIKFDNINKIIIKTDELTIYYRKDGSMKEDGIPIELLPSEEDLMRIFGDKIVKEV